MSKKKPKAGKNKAKGLENDLLQELSVSKEEQLKGQKEEEVEASANSLEQRKIAIAQKEQELKTAKEAVAPKKEVEALANSLEQRKIAIAQKEQELKIAKEAIAKKKEEVEALANSLEQRKIAIVQKEQELKTAKEAITQKEVELNEKRVQLEEKELQAKYGFQKLFAERFEPFKKQLEQREAECQHQFELLESRKQELGEKEREVQKALVQRDQGYADARGKLDEELFNLRQKQEKDLESKRTSTLSAIEKELSKERASRIASLEKEIADRQKAHEAAIQQDKDELEQKRQAFRQEQAKLDDLKERLEYQEKKLQCGKDNLEERESNLHDEVNEKVVERKRSFEIEKSRLDDEINRLRESLATSTESISNLEELKRRLGDEDPAQVLLKLKTYEEEIKQLREELTTRPTQEMQETFKRLKLEKEQLQKANEELSEENKFLRIFEQYQSDLQMKIDDLSVSKKSLQSQLDVMSGENKRLDEQLKRLQCSYKVDEDREARIKDIETPYIQKKLSRAADEVEELDWLDGISNSCIAYGLKFPRRILHAFHTALKTSEWSPMTVLAGVSGTGKSELPRLYSHFGGMNFLSLSVQPNWDSQESMLGFFNAIDNKFDAQPVLRLLAQSQKAQTEGYPFGLKDVMTLILMDEMNLAYVELYFAEFLSKLELRRGRKGNEVPSLEVKLGAGIPHYDLPLGRNVLWAGTMNQDETTKSLSDKVLDRGIVINFPRPTTLERRRQLKSLGAQAPLLSRKLWESWWCRESKFNDDQILPFKGFIEEMNTSLSKVGRALGHRVWQSIEYYMANYPDVLKAQREVDKNNKDKDALKKAMKVAFEDQLVQKVMPKLRGIETRGKSKSECLDRIRTQLVNDDYTIIEDFDLACEFGYGQFIWNSANYLKDDEDDKTAESLESEASIKSNIESVNSAESNNNQKKLMDIPKQLLDYAKEKGKELWELKGTEIKKAMSCDSQEAKRLKEMCNQTKGS